MKIWRNTSWTKKETSYQDNLLKWNNVRIHGIFIWLDSTSNGPKRPFKVIRGQSRVLFKRERERLQYSFRHFAGIILTKSTLLLVTNKRENVVQKLFPVLERKCLKSSILFQERSQLSSPIQGFSVISSSDTLASNEDSGDRTGSCDFLHVTLDLTAVWSLLDLNDFLFGWINGILR